MFFNDINLICLSCSVAKFVKSQLIYYDVATPLSLAACMLDQKHLISCLLMLLRLLTFLIFFNEY